MNELVGIVEEVFNNGKASGSGLRILGRKYSIFDPAEAGLDQISTGVKVSFRFKENEKGGIVYKNVVGKITPVADNVAVTATPATPAEKAASAGGGGKFRRNGEEGGFPIHQKSYERALDRRNALQCAIKFLEYETDMLDGLEEGQAISKVLEVAKTFEEYTTGDVDLKNEYALMMDNDTIL